jgi:uncharacterized membrane protein YbhN (UPF0104 family)
VSGGARSRKPSNAAPWRRWLVQASVSFAVLATLFWLLPTAEILDGIARVPPLLFAGVFLLFLVAHVFAAMKWWILTGRGVPAATALRAHFIGLTANLCLPGVAGGDAARVAVVWSRTADKSRLAAGSISDRLIDLVALCCIATVGLLLADHADGTLALKVLPVALAVFVAGLWIGPPLMGALWSAFPRLPAQAFVRSACEAASRIGRRPFLLFAVLVLSTLIQGCLVLLSLQLARSTGVEVPVAAWAFAWALAKLIVTLPVSLGGLGVREALLAALLAPFGAQAAEVVAGGLAWQAVLFLGGGVGGLLLAGAAAVPGRERLEEPGKGHSS